MILYLAGDSYWRRLSTAIDFKTNRLDSYYYLKKKPDPNIHKYNHFMLDSGAFTYMQNGQKVNWEAYVDEYADYVIHNRIKYFIEMDIDTITSPEHAFKLRQRLEARVGRQSIPCWHYVRGKQAWIDTVKEYDYAAISVSGYTDTSKWIKQHKYQPLHWFLQVARENYCKTHGLGFTQSKLLPQFPFYSVDSSSWCGGNRFGYIVIFKDGRITQHLAPKDGENYRLQCTPAVEHNFYEWIKFQRYAEQYL